jgi:hypothetical protein
MKLTRYIAPVLAFAAVGQAQAAQTQQACIAPADLGDTMVYAMPIAFDAARTACARQLRSDGFFARGGERFIAGFRARQNTAWPGTFRTMKALLAEDASARKPGDIDILALTQSMPESSLRPFVDGLMGQMITEEIKPQNCGKIERGIELLSPLPVDNVAGLMGFVAELLGLDKPALCTDALIRRRG